MTLTAYHNDPANKAAILAQLQAHHDADEIIKGLYWKDGRGCAVGCAIHSSNHAEYETCFGIPEMLARLEDCIFEGLPNGAAKAWPIRFMSAIRPGADLSRVGWLFLHWILTDEGVNPGIDHPLVRDAVRQCADVLVPLTKGQPIDNESAASTRLASKSASKASKVAWSAAEEAAASAESARSAWSAAEEAAASAWSAASSASAWAAESAAAAAEAAWAAESAAEAAESAASAWSARSAADAAEAAWSAESAAEAAESAAAAWSAAASASASASAWSARSAAEAAEAAWSAYIKMSDKLIELLEAA